jgi:hypothetical protein
MSGWLVCYPSVQGTQDGGKSWAYETPNDITTVRALRGCVLARVGVRPRACCTRVACVCVCGFAGVCASCVRRRTFACAVPVLFLLLFRHLHGDDSHADCAWHARAAAAA